MKRGKRKPKSVRLDAKSKDPRKNPMSKLSPAEARKYAPTPGAYFELMERVTTAMEEALGRRIEEGKVLTTVFCQAPDNTKLLELWNNNPLARAFIKAMIAVQPKIAELVEDVRE